MTWIALTTAPTIPSHITLKSSHSQNMCPSICKCECVCLGGLEMSTVLLVSKRYTSYARGVLSTPRRHAKSAAGSWTILAWSFTSFSESDTFTSWSNTIGIPCAQCVLHCLLACTDCSRHRSHYWELQQQNCIKTLKLMQAYTGLNAAKKHAHNASTFVRDWIVSPTSSESTARPLLNSFRI